MADENLDMESVRISELEQTTEVDRANDYLVVSRHSDAYIDDEKSFKITPDDLLDGVGVNYNAGAHIAIDNTTHTISATYTNATTSADGLMSKEDKSTVDSLQPVATSGDYNDLTNKPTEPKLPQTGERFDARVLMLFSVFLFLIGGAWILSGWKKDEQSETDEDIKE